MKKIKYIVPIISLFFFSGCFFSAEKIEISAIDVLKNNPDEIISEKIKCEIEKSRRVISGNSMEPMIKNKDYIWLYPDYYSVCKKNPQRGDLVAYDYSGRKIPIIKKVVATSEDIVQMKNGKLWVNGKEEKNSGGQSYKFSDPEQKLLLMAAKKNQIPQGALIILGDNIHNSQDSRKFGAVGVGDLLGKFEIY